MEYKKNKDKENSFMVYGINCCSSIINSTSCKINNIYISKDFKINKIGDKNKLYSKYKNKIKILSKDQYNHKYSQFRTQGVVINFTYPIYRDVLSKINDSKKCCYVILDSIKDPQNLGQIIRTSECAGVDGIIISDRRSAKVTNTVLQVSQGAFCNINIIISKNIKYSINELKENGYWVIGFENSISSMNWYEMEMTTKNALVFGSEGEGIRPIIKKYCDFLATIPMQGKINSLNISATVSAILFERNRQLLDNK